MNVERLRLPPSARFPNSAHPVLVYRRVFSCASADLAGELERLFASHGWPPQWRNGLYNVHHYHSTAHEVLGVYSGWVEARLGGESGVELRLEAGDALLIPAGVAHKNEAQSSDFRTVGAYPAGADYDMQYGKPGERPAADQRIARLSKPAFDPVCGAGGLVDAWD